MSRNKKRSVGASRLLRREIHRLTHANALLRRGNDRLCAQVRELVQVCDALRVERDATDALLGEAMDEVLRLKKLLKGQS
jgi:hypothetical protein